MKWTQLPTPATLADLDILERNLRRYQEAADRGGKAMVPMTKTHKSTALAGMQLSRGAAGLMVGTLDEAEAFASLGCPLVLAYPPAGWANLDRVCALAREHDLTLPADTAEGALALEEAAERWDVPLSVLVTVDVGLHRFGVAPERAGELAEWIGSRCPRLKVVGVASHPGQVYGVTDGREVARVAAEELERLTAARDSLLSAGVKEPQVHTGSTPTFFYEAESDVVTHLRPGNYVFCDAIQLSLGVCRQEDCALTLACTVISRREDGRCIVDCGSKRLGLDRGAHGNGLITGYGRVAGAPEAEVRSLSEEVAVVAGLPGARVGDALRIIPNHSCVPANLTDYLVGVRGDTVERLLPVDVRGGKRPPCTL